MQKRWNKLGCDVMINTVDPPVINKNNMITPSVTTTTTGGGGGGSTQTSASSSSSSDISGSGGINPDLVIPPSVNISPSDLARIIQLTPKDAEYWTAPLISPYAMPYFSLGTEWNGMLY